MRRFSPSSSHRHQGGAAILGVLLASIIGLSIIVGGAMMLGRFQEENRRLAAMSDLETQLPAFLNAARAWAQRQNPQGLANETLLTAADLRSSGDLSVDGARATVLGQTLRAFVQSSLGADGVRRLGSVAVVEAGSLGADISRLLGLRTTLQIESFKERLAIRLNGGSTAAFVVRGDGTVTRPGDKSPLATGISPSTTGIPAVLLVADLAPPGRAALEAGAAQRDSIIRLAALAAAASLVPNVLADNAPALAASAVASQSTVLASQSGLLTVTDWAPSPDPSSTDPWGLPGGWSRCSSPCGTGERTRYRRCLRADGTYAPMSECGLPSSGDPTLQSETQSCVTVCSFQYGGWSACAGGSGDWQASPWSGCTAQAWWSAGDWGGCSTSCDWGQQNRAVWCSQMGGTENRSVFCVPHGNSGTQSRAAACVNDRGETISDGFCGAPVTNQPCTPDGNICNPGLRPADIQACGTWCQGAPPESSQGCYSGPCCQYGSMDFQANSWGYQPGDVWLFSQPTQIYQLETTHVLSNCRGGLECGPALQANHGFNHDGRQFWISHGFRAWFRISYGVGASCPAGSFTNTPFDPCTNDPCSCSPDPQACYAQYGMGPAEGGD